MARAALEQQLRKSTGGRIVLPKDLPPPIAGPGRPDRYKLPSGKVVGGVCTRPGCWQKSGGTGGRGNEGTRARASH